MKDGDIKNFDPSRLPGYAVTQYESLRVIEEEAGKEVEVGSVAVPYAGDDPEEIKRQAMAFYRRAKFAEEYLDQKRVKEIAENTKPQTAEALAQWAALHVATNLCGVYAERTRKPFDDEAFVRCMEQQKELVLDILAEIPDLYDTLHVTIWRHAIAWALEQMEDEHDSETLETLSDDTFDDLLNEYIFDKQDFRDSAAHAMDLYAQDLARMILEAIDPVGMPLDRLKALIGLGGPQTVDEKQELLDRMLAVPSGAPYFALQEIVATKGFHKEEETPWPVARINRRGARGTAQLRPAGMDEQPFMPPDEVEAWSKIMWRHREQMSALDVDVMDALAAIYLQRTRNPNESTAADVDELLAMRGLKPKKGGSGTRGGYTPKQRREVMAAITRLQSIWLDMAEIDVYEEGPKGGRKRSRKTIQSRPFVITDRMGQVRFDGYMDVERFIFKPGAVFAHYLHGPGRQTALLKAKILELDPYREAWEKNIGRYLTNLWRIRARSGRYSDPLRVQTLLERTGYKLTPRRGMWIRERLEKALDALTDHGIINGWQYDRWNEATTEQRGWFKEWLQATVLIEPPDEIEEHYQEIEQPAAPKTLPAHSGEELGPRLKARRKQLRLTQMQAAEQLEITQAYFSQLERGRTEPGPVLARKIQTWLGEN